MSVLMAGICRCYLSNWQTKARIDPLNDFTNERLVWVTSAALVSRKLT